MQVIKVDLVYVASNGILLNLNFMAPFYGRVQLSLGDRVTAKETVYFLPQSPQDIVILI